MKQILENLREILPSDTNWKTIWQICWEPDSKWSKYVEHEKANNLNRKIHILRNKYVHELISVKSQYLNDLQKGINTLNQFCSQANELYGNTVRRKGW